MEYAMFFIDVLATKYILETLKVKESSPSQKRAKLDILKSWNIKVMFVLWFFSFSLDATLLSQDFIKN